MPAVLNSMRGRLLVKRTALAGTIAAASFLVARDLPEFGLLGALDRPTALLTFHLLGVLGIPVSIEWTTLAHPGGFAYVIDYRCTVLIPLIVVLGFVAICPVPVGQVAKGVIHGAVFVTAVNSVRLVGLYCIGVFLPQHFGVAHDWGGQALTVIGIIAYLGIWIRRLSRTNARGRCHAAKASAI